MHHYSTLKSLDFRTGSKYYQEKIGQSCMTGGNTVIGLSPQNTSHNQRSTGSLQGLREGVTYVSIGFKNISVNNTTWSVKGYQPISISSPITKTPPPPPHLPLKISHSPTPPPHKSDIPSFSY